MVLVLQPLVANPTPPTSQSSSSEPDITNRFDGLEIENGGDVDLEIMAADVLVPKSSRLKGSAKKQIFHMEGDVEEDIPSLCSVSSKT